MHHHIESVILSCLDSKSDDIVDHLIRECDLIGKFLQTDTHPILSGDGNKVDNRNYQLYAYIMFGIYNGYQCYCSAMGGFIL